AQWRFLSATELDRFTVSLCWRPRAGFCATFIHCPRYKLITFAQFENNTLAWKQATEIDRKRRTSVPSSLLNYITEPFAHSDGGVDLEHALTWWLEFKKPGIAAGMLTAERYRLSQ